jgi:hypothetical protein
VASGPSKKLTANARLRLILSSCIGTSEALLTSISFNDVVCPLLKL